MVVMNSVVHTHHDIELRSCSGDGISVWYQAAAVVALSCYSLPCAAVVVTTVLCSL